MLGKRFEKEFQMINQALKDDRDNEEFRKYLTPFVLSVVDQYILENNIISISRDILAKAGWKYFQIALKKYKGRAELMVQGKNDIFYFSTYFNWYIRQGILEYLNTLN